MSRKTIQMVDLLCDVGNWNNSIQGVVESPAFEPGAPAAWVAEAEQEIKEWSAKRDKKLARLQTIIAALTPQELKLIKSRYEPEKLARELREIGVAPRW